MKLARNHDSSNRSCSCTTCLYKSESDRPSVSQFLAHGTRIDKLYYGKYIPLRERKLLQRLVTTKAEYDDLRKQILSDSSVSFGRPIVKSKANKLSRYKEHNRIVKNNSIVALINKVDKSAAHPIEYSSECCSCCSCGSKISINEPPKRRLPIHKHAPRHIWRQEYNHSYSRNRKKLSKLMVSSKHKLGQISELGKKVRFRTKRVRSEPCTCTYKLSDMLEPLSSVMKNRFVPEIFKPAIETTIGPVQHKTKQHNSDIAVEKLLQNVKHSYNCLCNKIEGDAKRSTTNVRNSVTKITKDIKSVANESADRLKNAKYKMKKIFDTPRNVESLIFGDVENETNAFIIEKDSLSKFRDKLRSSRERKDWECKYECSSDQCDPQECLKILKRKEKRHIRDNQFPGLNKIEKKVGKPTFASDISIQVDAVKNTLKTGKKIMKSKYLKAYNQIGLSNSGVNVDIKKKDNIKKGNLNLENYNITKLKDHVRKKRQNVKFSSGVVPMRSPRQAVRVGSSFSFNIELYKDKPSQNILKENRNKSHKAKSQHFDTRKRNTKDSKDEVSKSRKNRLQQNKSGKYMQSSAYPLKQCFCTLQLKRKRNKMHVHNIYIPKSVQTNKLQSAYSITFPYEHNICVPGKCNPTVCNKIITKEKLNHRYIPTNSNMKSKSINASTTSKSKSLSSITPNEIQTHANRKLERITLSTAPADIKVSKKFKPPRKAVRIGSSFSFNIEFSKENPSSSSHIDVKTVTRPLRKSYLRPQRTNVYKARRYIRNKYSQISNTAKKSRPTITKLRRCFCTLKLGVPDSKRNTTSMSKSTILSSHGISKTAKLYRTAAVGADKKSKRKKHNLLLPYECEPGICLPEECNPYICRKILYSKQSKYYKRRSRNSNTESRKTKSTSTFTSGLQKSIKTKKVQSAFAAYTKKLPIQAPNKTVTTSELVDKQHPNIFLRRQAVKIGSNLSVNIEFYKERQSDITSVRTQRVDQQVTPVVNIYRQPKPGLHQSKVVLNYQNMAGTGLKRKSLQMQVHNKKKHMKIDTAIKHCLCLGNINKKAKDTRQKKVVSIGTKTPHFARKLQPYAQNDLQKTMAMIKLDPYECEPYVCIPGECNPYECLEIMSKKNSICYYRDIGLTTKPINLRSISSSTKNNVRPSKTSQSKIVEIQNFSKKKRSLPSLSSVSGNLNANKTRQAVKIGSTFSFDIGFYKNLEPEQLKTIQGELKDRIKHGPDIKINRNKSQLFQVPKSHRESQAEVKKFNKETRIALIKKCLCSLKLWKKQEINSNKKKVSKTSGYPAETRRQIESYTVGRVTTGNNKYIPQSAFSEVKKKYLNESTLNRHIATRISNTNRLLDFGLLQNTKTINNYTSPSIVNPNIMQRKFSFSHVQSLAPIVNFNNYKGSSQTSYTGIQQFTKSSKPLTPLNGINTDFGTCINSKNIPKYRLKEQPYIFTSQDNTTCINHTSPFSKNSFYAMNIQVVGRQKHPINKLEPYECEPGVCTPYECNPLKCEELINKRSKVFGTETNVHAGKSITSQTIPSTTKARKLQPSKEKEYYKKPSTSNLEYKTSSENRHAVRVGSNFNFNIEFLKSKSNDQKIKRLPSKEYRDKRMICKRKGCQNQQQIEQQKSKQIRTLYSTLDKESQSEYLKKNQESSTIIPQSLKKCFCTLKFKKQIEQKSAISTKTQPFKYSKKEGSIIKFKNEDSAQNTKSFKSHKNKYKLKSYECKPEACIVNRFDPYQCLQSIKNRKTKVKKYGAESVSSENVSSSNTTTKKTTKMHNKQLDSKVLDVTRKFKRSSKKTSGPNPTRQTVRIGSNFSFNVEFFKQKSDTLQNTKTKFEQAQSLKTRTSSKKIKRAGEHKKYLQNSKESYSQNIKSIYNKGSQASFTRSAKSTMTNSFLRKCFCVAKLYKNQTKYSDFPKRKESIVQPQKTSSFLERCYCVLKSVATGKNMSKNLSNLQAATLTQTKYSTKPLSGTRAPQKLAPYECESGTCTPGLCDPYVCDQIIKNRKGNGVTKITHTGKYNVKTVSSSSKNLTVLKDRKTYVNKQNVHKQLEYPTSNFNISNKKKFKPKGLKTTISKQAVTIGSNFSFDIEFFKKKEIDKLDNKDSFSVKKSKNQNYNTNMNAHITQKHKGCYGRKSTVFNRETQAHSVKMESRASGVNNLLQRCFCTSVLQKNKLKERSSKLATVNNNVSNTTQTPFIKNKNIMALDKTFSYKLKPYECEPNICIPGSCNPYVCEKNIQRRLQTESSTLTDIHKTKSASSLVLKPFKNKNIKVQSALKSDKESLNLKHEKETKIKVPSYSANLDNIKGCKQAVKISSNFDFNIEFSKNRSCYPRIKISKLPKNTYKNATNNTVNQKSISYIERESQAIKRKHNIGSQVLLKSGRSTMTGVMPLLKRCFCTLNLQKSEAKPTPIIKNTTAVGSNLKEIYSLSPKIDICNKATRTLNTDTKHTSLIKYKPYECEPGVCIPGKCNPYECIKVINKREKRMVTKSSITQGSQNMTKNVSTKNKTKSKKLQPSFVEQNTLNLVKKKRSSTYVKYPSKHRQAVHVTSSFNFNVEFYKDGTPRFRDDLKNRKLTVTNEKGTNSIRKLGKKNTTVGNDGINFQHRKSQFNRTKTESIGSGMAPLLKRCFCTLKLQKLRKHSKVQNISQKPIPAQKSSYTETTDRARTQSNLYHEINKVKNLEPYECLPGTCIPGMCNPFECERRIKKRQIRELGTVTNRCTLKSTSTIASGNKKMRSIQSQKRTLKKGKNNLNKSKRIIKPILVRSNVDTSNRQAVRVGSTFSFDIEFYKDRSLKHAKSLPLPHYANNSKKSKNIETMRKHRRMSKAQGSQNRRSSYGRGSQAVITYSKSKGSGAPTRLKKCYCTLALQQFSGIPLPNNRLEDIPKQRINLVEVSTQTKLNPNKINRYSLEPYECEPGICIPGQCNPYECIQIMKQHSRRHSRTAGTQRRQSSRISVSSSTYPSFSKSKTVQSGGKYRKNKKLKSKENDEMIVKEPRCLPASDLKGRQAVKIGSNFSFNVEFSKKKVFPEINTNPNNTKEHRLSSQKSNKLSKNSKVAECTRSTCKVIDSRSHKSQSQRFKTEDKASHVGNILKRCFCTAKLHSKSSTLRPKITTINRLENQLVGPGFNKQQQYFVYYQLKKTKNNVCPKRCKCTTLGKDSSYFTNTVGTRTKNKYLQLEQNFKNVQTKCTSKQMDPKKNTLADMKIILPYIPSKFNKKASKAILILRKCHPTCDCDFDQNDSKKHQHFIDNEKSGGSKRLYNKEVKLPRSIKKFAKLSTCNLLKVAASRCKGKFVKQAYKTDSRTIPQSGNQIKCLSISSKKKKSLSKRSHLKISKSERRTIDKGCNEPKTSKSLKMTNNAYKNEPSIVNHQKNKKYSWFQQGDTNQNKTIPAVIKLHKTGDSNAYKKYVCPHCQLKYDNKLAKGKLLKPSKQKQKTVKFSGVTVESYIKKTSILNNLKKKICKCIAVEDTKIKQPTKIEKDNVGLQGDFVPRKKSMKLLGPKEYCEYCNEARYDVEKSQDNINTRKENNYQSSNIKKNTLNPKTSDINDDFKRKMTIPGHTQIKRKHKFLRSSEQEKVKADGVAKENTGLIEPHNKEPKDRKNTKAGAKIAVVAKTADPKKSCECMASMNKDREAKILAKKMAGKICACDPSVCDCAKAIKMEKERAKKRKAFLKRQLNKAKKIKKNRRRKEIEKQAAEKRRRRNFYLRQKRYKIEDTLRLHKRRDLDQYLEHRLKTKDTPDYLVATESVLDLAKLSCTVLEDIARSTYRAMIDPQHTYKRVEATVKQPSRIWPIIKTAVVNSGAPATFKRIILRCKTMSSVKKIRAKLEQNRCTHYLLHIADRDPRKRLKMKKAQERLKRQRVPLDFQCSLYMASLRKKPYLKVYFKCPWFYPHFINILGVLRQLADMLLFILAAVVWSPCILGMEICRAMMCCLLCTG